ncbi:MAG TPA: baseplate J/gp47 family protein [Candidatus Dormibacteraeota bacterium]|nr:baseplate J/gp47 family protein [Candidatus Dormibacteraeota bacterium]
MKTLAKLLYVEADEEITDLVDRLRDLSLEDEVTFVVPDRARALQSAMSFRLLKRYADSYGKRVNLVSGDPRLQAMSLEAGFMAYPSLSAYDSGSEVHQPSPVDEALAAATAAPAVTQAQSQVGGSASGVATLDRPRQAAVVSGPPKAKPPTPPRPASAGPPLRSYRPYLIGAGVLVLIGLVFGVLYLPTATATLTVAGTPLKGDVTLLGAPGAAAGSPDHFATQAVHAEQSQTLPGTPTGQKQIAAVAASGSVTFTENCFFLCTNGAKAIPAGTSVSTSDGKQYTTQKTVNVSSPHGSVSVGITATVAGPNGNTDVHTITNINNSPDDSLSVDNPSSVGGGADARTATIIQQSDLDAPLSAYSKDAIPQVTDQLNSKAQGKKLVLVGSGVQGTVTADHKVGEEVSGFTVTVKVAGDAVAFDDQTVKAMLKSGLLRKVPQGSQLTTENIALSYDAIDATADGHVTLNGHASGFYTPVFLDNNIRSHLKGMSPSKAHAFLQSLPSVVDARVVQSPFGLPWLPLFSSRITLKIQEVSGSSSA